MKKPILSTLTLALSFSAIASATASGETLPGVICKIDDPSASAYSIVLDSSAGKSTFLSGDRYWLADVTVNYRDPANRRAYHPGYALKNCEVIGEHDVTSDFVCFRSSNALVPTNGELKFESNTRAKITFNSPIELISKLDGSAVRLPRREYSLSCEALR